ncbi:MAG: YitT family protein [Clostridia bacterium]|nr:YitT family protein [Clostridia bacterium]
MKAVKDFMLINTGLVLVALGIYLFKIPNRFATGGISGVAIVIRHFFPGIAVGPIMITINVVLLIVGYAMIGPNFTSRTIYSSFALSGMVWLMEKACPLSGPITNDTFLELIYAILLPAVGSAIVFNQDASTGGTDIIARILTKYTHIHVGKTLLMADFIITLSALAVFGIRIGMYSILGLVLKGFLIDLVIEGMNVGKQIVIITTNPDKINEFIIKKLKRGATVTKAVGAYTKEEKHVITTVVNRSQAVRLRSFVRQADEKAFMTITNTSEIIGRGFRNADLL